MIKTYFLLLFSLIVSYSYSQEIFTLNQGGTDQKAYFSEVNYESVRDKIIVKAIINGKNYRFIVDTGAPNMITKKVFEALNPTILKKIPIADANNKTDSLTVVLLSEIKLGNVTFNNIPTLVAEDTFIFDCHEVDGFIGSNMLRNTIVRFSSKDHKIILTDETIQLPLNKNQRSDLILTPAQSSPFLTTTVKGKGKGKIELLFDTGMEGMFDLALKHYAILEKENIFDELAKSNGQGLLGLNGLGNDTIQHLLRVPELTINGTLFKNVSIQTTPNLNSRIGANLLKYGIVTVDYKNKKFYFEPFDTTVDLLEKHFPITISIKKNKAVIGTVWDEKLKDEISQGDELLAVDDMNYEDINPCDLITKTKILEGKTQVTLTLKNSKGLLKKIFISKSIQ
ncbi:retroviral-like aspartic protease family protein [Sphingobacterium sp. SRCM116780]|uniref:retropepsin-like aspartic protease n=1 Tax=Sphingobacterium sp. SRCM116780 TaxID=2907623 RepID=UPI001F385713|nr:retropepsin-like aspartic protease [Sphingobacterium sp. SRCM116780]UIR57433.1 retroviral-like aspartic protease family protein [Sphingobacterium sp. SRCM116780]